VAKELENKTITTVLSKPVQRPIFIIAKFFGVAAAVVLAHYICTIALLMAIRHGVLETVNDTHDWTVLGSAGVIVLAAFLLSAFFNYAYDWKFSSTAIVLTGIFATLGIVFLSFIDRNWQFNPQDNGINTVDIYGSVLLLLAAIIIVALAVKIGRFLVPNIQIFWISDAIYEGSEVPLKYIAISASYALCYTTAILALAVALFQRRQVG
jgi:ABC-type transport system involved in multi-copper enzyme maturation permease subunit